MEPQFAGTDQTKTGQSEVEGIVKTVVTSTSALPRGAPAGRPGIIEKGRERARAREAARGARPGPQEVGAGEHGAARQAGDCSIDDSAHSEIYLVEAIGRRQRQAGPRPLFQAILPLRGKILNGRKARIDKISSQRGDPRHHHGGRHRRAGGLQADDARYHKIILMTDATSTGHIRTLLLTFFFGRGQELIEAGYVYIAQPPSNAWQGKEEFYAYTEADAGRVQQRITNDDGGRARSTFSATRVSGI